MSNLKQKCENAKCSFSKNLLLKLIFPAVAIILAVVFSIIFGFNKGFDLNGGLMVSVVSGTEVNLEDSKTYNEFKKDVDQVLAENNLNGKIYTVEVNQMQEYVLVVKCVYNGTEEQANQLVSDLKSDLVTKFYASTPDYEVENNNYVIVQQFGPSITDNFVLTTILATLVGAILMAVYISIRKGLNAGIIAFLLSVFNNLFALAVVMNTRVIVNTSTFIIVPFVTVITMLSVLLFTKKAKDTLSASDKFDTKSNYILADVVTKKLLYSQVIIGIIATLEFVLIGAINMFNETLFIALAFEIALLTVGYTNLFILPGLFAKTFIRKVKKERVKKENLDKPQENKKLDEEVLVETDLDKLTTN